MSRRGMELLLLVFGVAFVAFVAISFRPAGGGPRARDGRSTEVPPPREAGPATTLSSGFDFTESVRGKPLFRIKAEKTAGFGLAPVAGGSPDLFAGEKVALTVYRDGAQPLNVNSDRAEYDARTRGATLEGNVRWADANGAMAETGKLLFNPNDRVLLVPGALHFVRGRFDLRASSGRYDVASSTLALAGPIEGSGLAERSAAVSELHSDNALYRKDEGIIELMGHVRAASGEGDSIESAQMVLKLEDPGGHLTWARANGEVHGTVAPTRMADAHSELRHYAGDEAAFFFDADGEIKNLTLNGSPASADEVDRRVTAKTIDLEFSGKRAVAAHARGDVLVTAPNQERAAAERGDLAFAADGSVEGLTLAGKVRLQGESRSGHADRAVQLPATRIWVLTGDASSSAGVEQEGSRVSAPRIEIDDARKIVRAEGGGVRAVLAPARGDRANPTIVGDPSRPTFGKAEKMVFDQSMRTASLSGGAALWQDASSLFGRDVTLNDAERSVAAVGEVRAVLVPKPNGSPQQDLRPTVLTSSRLLYREAPEAGANQGRADLDGDVVAVRGPFRASGKTGMALIGPERQVTRLEMTGGVAMSDAAAGRTGQAEHAVDLPEEGRTILEGSPARVTDRDGSRVSGAILTITERGRRVEVTAPEGGKTETIHQTKRDR